MKKFVSILMLLSLCCAPEAVATNPLAPNFTLRDINGEEYRLSDHRGEIIVLNFWATWCNPCMAELPHLNQIDKNYEDQDVNVVAISIDAARHASKVKAYVKSRRYAFTTLIDRDTTVVAQYNPSKGIPYTVVIDRQGRIVHFHTGYAAGDEKIYINLIEEMLANESR